MILPDKNLSLKSSLLGAGYFIIRELSRPQPVATLWERSRKYKGINNFEKFVLVLDLLYLVGIVSIEKGLIVKKQKRND